MNSVLRGYLSKRGRLEASGLASLLRKRGREVAYEPRARELEIPKCESNNERITGFQILVALGNCFLSDTAAI